ncbi:hypothetical protein [Roseivirga misakiensis]|uniref:Uncharacterized protein n=1 Tax=Roseivirga misakiensis TaxID=1563681 RepID=A0A1E5SZI6_9BACT|nr:hypothetical protein [Roseivirga misakiensis]OEK04540.1 hypothetical protein BFP71_13825 [Roseivirga misakiensis]
MRDFGSLKIMEQGIEIMSTTSHLKKTCVQTDLAGLIKEINLLAIQIPSNIAASSADKTSDNYEIGLKKALSSVRDIENKLEDVIPETPLTHPLNRLKQLVSKEEALIEHALNHSKARKQNRPLKRSRLSVVSGKSRSAMPKIKVSQGLQVELF